MSSTDDVKPYTHSELRQARELYPATQTTGTLGEMNTLRYLATIADRDRKLAIAEKALRNAGTHILFQTEEHNDHESNVPWMKGERLKEIGDALREITPNPQEDA